MAEIRLETRIAAPVERCFDLARSVELHVASTAGTREAAVGGVTSGLLGLGDEVTWEARHLAARRRLTVRIDAFDRPRHFRDTMVRGPFARFEHDHFFAAGSATTMTDVLRFASPLSPVGRLGDRFVLRAHLMRLVARRNEAIRAAAEGEAWRTYLR